MTTPSGQADPIGNQMHVESDLKVQAAKDLLESWLLDVFNSTSNNCKRRISELEFPGDVIPGAIDDWREKSLERINAGFERLFAVIRESPQDPGDAPADIAKNLTWESIDKAFNWAGGDRNSSSRFKEWRTEAGAAAPSTKMLEMLGVSLSPEHNWDAPLVRDFQTQFEHLLNQLRNEAFLNTPSARSTTPADSSDSNASGIQSDLTHSEDYRTITVSGKHYVLTPNQALIIRALHEASVKGIQAVSAATLRKSIGVGHGSRIRDSFRGGDGPKLWRKFVVQVVKGMYALKLPRRR